MLALIDHFAMGGAETLLSRFAAAAPRAGVELTIACLEDRDGNPAAQPLLELGIHPSNLDLAGRKGLRALGKLRRLVGSVKPDVVHTHLPSADALGGLAARSLALPMVCTIHGTIWSSGNRVEHAKRMLVRACASRIIAVSDSARAFYVDRGWGRPDQVVTIHNGIDATAERGAGAEVRSELGLEPDDFVVGMISALRPEKAHDLALEAVEHLRDRFPRLRLVIAGQGPLADQIRTQGARLGDAVKVIGPRLDVMRIFDSLDLCLHPSRSDAFPTTLIEAMVAEVPVLATAVGGIPEILVDGRTGVLMPPGPPPELVASTLAALVEDPARRRLLARQARQEYDERLTADIWVRATRALYDEVLSERRRPPRDAGELVHTTA